MEHRASQVKRLYAIYTLRGRMTSLRFCLSEHETAGLFFLFI